MKKVAPCFKGAVLGLSVVLASCGGGAAGSGGSVSVSSLTSLPSLTDMVGTTEASGNVSALRALVSGTAPILSQISADDADTLFWNGLLADIDQNGATSDDADAFWQGEGRCRMAQSVGYSFQNIEQAGASLCYMKNAPNAESGISVTSGGIEHPNEAFVQQPASRLIRVDTTGQDEGGDQHIFIRVYGSGTAEGSDGYAVDLYFCDEGEDHSRGLEQIRVNTSTGRFTQSTAETSFGDFVLQASAQLTQDSEGNLSFDPDSVKTAEVYFNHEDEFLSKSVITIDGDTISSKDYGSFGDFINKSYTVSHYTGADLDNLRFLEAGFAGENSFEGHDNPAYHGATEFQTSRYAQVNSGSLFNEAADFDFSADSFFSSGFEEYADLLEDANSGDCSATPDIILAMDFSDPGMEPVGELCQSSFSDMNFCDSDLVNEARNAVFAAH